MENKYFYGNKISEHGIENNRVDFGTFAKAFNHVMINSIFEVINFEDLEAVTSCELFYLDEDGNEIEEEVFQWFVVDDTPNNRDLMEEAKQICYYCEKLDCLVWGVTHFGTSWDYVLTNIKIDQE